MDLSRIPPFLMASGALVVLAALLPAPAPAQACSSVPAWLAVGEPGEPVAPRAEPVEAGEETVSLVGRVRDGTDGVPVPGARVDFRWEDEEGRQVEGESWTDATGRFRLCDIPPGVPVSLRAHVGGGPGPEVEALTDSGEMLALEVPLPSPDLSSGLLGTVLETESEQEVSDAEIRIPALGLSTSTDRRGTFFFEKIDPGSYLLEIRHLSYGTVRDSVHLVAGRPLQARFSLSPDPIRLEGVTARARSRVWFGQRADIRRRMRRTSGDFITRDEILRRNEPPLHMLLSTVPGVRISTVSYPWGPSYYPIIRSCGMPAMYVDGARVSVDGGGTSLDINSFLSSDIEIIEIHKGATAPRRFSNNSACGAILIWTRQGM